MVYIDLYLHRDLRTRHHSSGNFPQAYLVALEIGYNVKNLPAAETAQVSLDIRVLYAEFVGAARALVHGWWPNRGRTTGATCSSKARYR